jgi:hypothetical protein
MRTKHRYWLAAWGAGLLLLETYGCGHGGGLDSCGCYSAREAAVSQAREQYSECITQGGTVVECSGPRQFEVAAADAQLQSCLNGCPR